MSNWTLKKPGEGEAQLSVLKYLTEQQKKWSKILQFEDNKNKNLYLQEYYWKFWSKSKSGCKRDTSCDFLHITLAQRDGKVDSNERQDVQDYKCIGCESVGETAGALLNIL
jgi:hypothetical protein